MSTLGKDTILYRGMSVDGLAGLLGMTKDNLLAADEASLNDARSTRVIKDEGFTSTGAAENTGFIEQPVQLQILAPATTQAIYCDPFSALGGTAKYQDDHNDAGPPIPVWDGETPARSLGTEVEILLQRGTSFEIKDVKITGDGADKRFVVIVQIIRQEPGEIK
jgi:hypothetical protein